jgi:hypothetical protein
MWVPTCVAAPYGAWLQIMGAHPFGFVRLLAPGLPFAFDTVQPHLAPEGGPSHPQQLCCTGAASCLSSRERFRCVGTRA